MAHSETPPPAVQSNIETVVRLEREAEDRRTRVERAAERVGAFAGTIWFILAQFIFTVFWVLANTGWIPGIPIFDPFPFPLWAAVLSLEGVMLTAFVLTSQNWASLKADRRNHLELQINLLSEQEVTKVIQMLGAISRKLGIEHEAVDQEARELSKLTAVDDLARHATRHLDAEGEAPRS
jgi:uncharacterized membrane protein